MRLTLLIVFLLMICSSVLAQESAAYEIPSSSACETVVDIHSAAAAPVYVLLTDASNAEVLNVTLGHDETVSYRLPVGTQTYVLTVLRDPADANAWSFSGYDDCTATPAAPPTDDTELWLQQMLGQVPDDPAFDWLTIQDLRDFEAAYGRDTVVEYVRLLNLFEEPPAPQETSEPPAPATTQISILMTDEPQGSTASDMEQEP